LGRESCTLPQHTAASLQVRKRGNFLDSDGNADDDALSPAAMTAFERCAHQIYVTDAFESVVGATDLIRAAFGHVDKVRYQFASDLGRIDKMRHAEAFAPCLLLRVHVDANNHRGADEAQSLDHVQANAAETEHNALGASFDLGGIDHRAYAGGGTTADVTHFFERRLPPHFCDGDFGQYA